VSHHAGRRFWRLFDNLPPEIQQLALENYELLKADPRHPSLRFKRVGRYWAARVGHSYRAVGIDVSDGIFWFWIGPHDEYMRLFG